MQKGFIAITTTLIVGAVVLAIAGTVAVLAIGQGQAGLSQTNGQDILYFVDGCAEDALLKLHASALYAGGTITRPEGTCNVTISNVGITYTLTVTNSTTAYKRTVQIVANRGSTLTITTWKEI